MGMLPEKNTEVPGTNEGGVSPQETPDQGGVAQQPQAAVQPTPSPSPNTVDVEEIKAKYEKDIAQLKSSLQRRESQVTAEWQKRYTELQRQMHETRMQSMTDEERERYERQLESEEMQSLQSRLAELENERMTMQQTYNAHQFFLQQGVPAEKLNLAEGYDAVVQGGWQYLTEELARLRQLTSNPQPQPQKPEPAPLPQAPGVVTDKGTPATGTTWAALRKQFGSDEAVYRAVEEQRLDPSIIPVE